MSAARYTLTDQEHASASGLIAAMRNAAPPGARITIATVIHAALERGLPVLAREVNGAPKHWAALALQKEDEDAPPESSKQVRDVPIAGGTVLPFRALPRAGGAPFANLATFEAITAARALIALAADVGLMSPAERVGLDGQLVPGVFLSTLRALALDLVMAAPIGSAVDRAGRALFAALSRGRR
jgi:hypothetical protein